MNISAIDLNLLVAFEALMDERSVSRAAKRIGLSQPAMSNALARLRRTFDDPLLVHTPKGMIPTSAALTLIIPVRSALLQLRTAFEEKPAFDPAASRRAFHVLANDYAEILLLAPLMRRLEAQAPHVNLRLHRPSSLFQPPTAPALTGTFDLALGFFPDMLPLDAGYLSKEPKIHDGNFFS